MATCVVCGKEIPRGKRYKGEHYQTTSFCSEECYDEFIQAKQSHPKSQSKDKYLVVLKDYINSLWNEQVNWPWMMRQIKSMKEKYGLDSQELYLVLKYAVVYEDYVVDTSYGLGQFIRFIQPAFDFAEVIKRNKELAKNYSGEEQVIVVKPHKQIRHIKDEDWDD